MSDHLAYVVLTGPKKEPLKLANKVTLMMADGWWVQGGLAISGQVLYQAMSKRAAVAPERVASAASGDWVEPA